MKTKNLLKATAAVSILTAMFSCAKVIEPEVIPVEQSSQTGQGKTYTLTVVASKGDAGTKALSLEGKTLTASWKEGEEVDVYKGDNKIGTLTARSSGTSTTLTGTITGTLAQGDNLVLKFCSPKYATQKGTLDYIAANCDYATAEVSVSSIDETAGTITIGAARFVSQQAVVKFTLKWNTGEPLSAGVDQLTIQAGESTKITVTPNPRSNVLFVAIPALVKADIDMKAIDMNATYGEREFVYSKKSVTFEPGKYYEIGVKMSMVIPILDELALRAFLASEQDIHDGATGLLRGDITLNIADPYSRNPSGAEVKRSKILDLNRRTLSGHNDSRIFLVTESASLTLTGGGTVKEGNDENGGAIYNSGTLLIEDVTISDSYGKDCGGVYNATGGTLTIDGVTVSGNESGLGGGGIVNYGTAVIRNAVIGNNVASTRGGGIWNSGILTVENTVVRGNTATTYEGGGVHVKGGSATLDGVTLEGNTSPDGGAMSILEGASVIIQGTSVIRNNSTTDHGGGGITNDGTLSIQDDLTLTGNTSVGRGGGIFQNGTLNLKDAPKIYGNHRGSADHNVFITTGRFINVNGAFSEEADVHVTMEKEKGVFTSGYSSQNGATDPAAFFSSDGSFCFQLKNGEAALIVAPSYEAYLGRWKDNNSGLVLSVSQKVKGSTYSISGLNGQGDYPVEAVFERGRLVVYEQFVSSSGGTRVALQGGDGSNPSYPGSNPGVLLNAATDEIMEDLSVFGANGYSSYSFNRYVNQGYDGSNGGGIPSGMKRYALFFEDFERGEDSLVGWTRIDLFEDGSNWYVEGDSGQAHSGRGTLASPSLNYWTHEAYKANNWAFTPPIQLADKDCYVSFWVTAQSGTAYKENYAVWVTDKEPEKSLAESAPYGVDTIINLLRQTYPEGNPVETARNYYKPDGYQHYILQIPSKYNGKTVYVAFQHVQINDPQLWINIDDVSVF